MRRMRQIWSFLGVSKVWALLVVLTLDGMSMNIRWRRPRIKSPYSSLFYSDFVFVFADLVSSFIFFSTNSHINYFTSGWHPGPWVRKFVVGSPTLFHCKKAVQAQVCLKWTVMLMVSQEAYPRAIPGTEEGCFSQQSACDETLCETYKKQANYESTGSRSLDHIYSQ